MDSLSDPGRPSRRDRRRAQKLVDTAFAEQRLTAADRSLRTQRIEAAHTRGDLVMITRDLVAPATTNLGRALDPAEMSSMQGSTGTSTTSAPSTLRTGTTPTVDLSGIGRRVRLIVLVVVGGMLLSCVLGIAAFIPAVIGAFENVSPIDVPSDPPSDVAPRPEETRQSTPSSPVADQAASLHTADGWTGLVDAIEEKSGTSEIYDLVVYPQYASVGLNGDGAVERGLYREGAWQDAFSIRTPAVGSPVDLAEIDAGLIARLPQETAGAVGIDEPTGTYLIVNAYGGEARIMVYVQEDVRSEYRAYRLDGTPMS